jgi:lipoprotein-anchoring transpeptidase ErfK/SrfK
MSAHVPRLLLGLLAVLTLVLSLGGALGMWSTGAPAAGWQVAAAGQPGTSAHSQASLRPAASRVRLRDVEGTYGDVHRAEPSATPAPSAAPSRAGPDATNADPAPAAAPAPAPTGAESSADVPVPAQSGTGRRVVFDMSEQRVWLVGANGTVLRTYLVSGSRTDNLSAGHYEVYSRSPHAVSYTYEETMRYMVRFATGEQAAIGFHDIPRDQQGRPVQTRDQLGRPMSAGCIRQARADAIALWRFAGVGTSVDVVP